MGRNYISKEELYSKIGELKGQQEKFIMLAIYHNIGGNLEGLCNLKTKDIDLENKIICSENKIIHMDHELYEAAKGVLKQTSVEKLIFKKEATTIQKEYDLNMESEYVLKVKPNKRNNNGLNPMKARGLEDRIYSIIEYLNLDITTKDIRSSKVVDLVVEAKKFTVNEIRDFLKKNDIKLSGFLIYKKIKALGLNNK